MSFYDYHHYYLRTCFCFCGSPDATDELEYIEPSEWGPERSHSARPQGLWTRGRIFDGVMRTRT